MNPILLENFFKLRPKMLEKYNYLGIFKDYSRDITRSLSPLKYEGNLCRVIVNRVRNIFHSHCPGEVCLERLEKQFSHFPFISYADHHGLLNYKLLYNSNLLYYEIVKTLDLPFLVVLAAANVPLDNMSYPRGFYFKNRKFNFFAADESRSPVFLFEKKLNVGKGKEMGIDCFIKGEARDMLTFEEKKFLDFLFFNCLEIQDAAEIFDNFSDQITFLNYKLWPYYFEKSLRNSLPRLIYLPSTPVLLDILCREIMKKDSLVSLIIFEPKIRNIFLKNFFGIAGCWTENTGSHLFWGVSEKKKYKRLIRLTLDNSSHSLIGENFKLVLEPEAVMSALKSKKIIATLFFDYLILTFLEGYLTLGGFNQLDYLPQMQQAHIKSLSEIGMTELAACFSSRRTDGLVCGMMPCQFDSGIDLIWQHNSHNGKFNNNLDNGLNKDDLDRILAMNVQDMILSAVEIMLENVSTPGKLEEK